MAFYVPYVIDDAEHSARLFRRQFQQSVGEGSGVSRPEDLRVQALNTPGPGFRVGPGGAVIQSRDTTVSARESYGPINDAEVEVLGLDGAPSSGSRRDMVILEIVDPEMDSLTYDPVEAAALNYTRIRVVQGVPASAKTVADVPSLANVTAYALAAIQYPANVSTIQPNMITDLREVADPFRAETAFARPRVAADDSPENYLSGRDANGGEYFPGGGGYANQVEIDIPLRATRMIVEADWMSVIYYGGKDAFGNYWVEFGTEYRPNTWPSKQQYEFATQKFAFDTVGKVAGTYRSNWRLMDNVPVPAKLRGKRVTFVFKAGLAANAQTQAVAMNSMSGLGLKLTFVETALTWQDAV
ncbi:hypothetical protein [Leucobacter sp. M11]|uniref:hypothetical protein n=1 Tax=Leucobacter sp. M11 TaxID=2993565 RepID=UPI002D807930|nr:hypothetical protein [Leucobacter sp. M11]MEB4614006.1 hypothetical protein [Leucobacter sp. M11]